MGANDGLHKDAQGHSERDGEAMLVVSLHRIAEVVTDLVKKFSSPIQKPKDAVSVTLNKMKRRSNRDVRWLVW